MISESLGEQGFILRPQQAIHRPGWKLIESLVGGSKYCEWSWTFEGIDQSGSFYSPYQGGMVRRIDGILDDVLGWEHFFAPNHRIVHSCDGGTDCHGHKYRNSRELSHACWLNPFLDEFCDCSLSTKSERQRIGAGGRILREGLYSVLRIT